MPDQKSGKLAKAAAKPAAKKPIKRATPPKAQLRIVKNVPKPPPGVPAKPTKDQPVSLTKSSKPSEKAVAKDEAKKALVRPAAAATDEGTLIDLAKQNTTAMLRGLFGSLGYTNISVIFDE